MSRPSGSGIGAVVLGFVLAMGGQAGAQSGGDPSDLRLPDDDPPLLVDDEPAPPPPPAVRLDAGPTDAGAIAPSDVPADDADPVGEEEFPADSDPQPDSDLPELPAPDPIEQDALNQGTLTPRVDRGRGDELLDLPAAVSAPEISTEDELARHIEARAAALRAGDIPAAELELALIEEMRLSLAARNVVVVSAQLIQEAKVALQNGDIETAVSRADAAARLSPDLEAAHWMRARLQWRRDKTQVPLIIDALRDLLGARFRVFRNQISFVTQLLTLLGLALVASIALFAFLQLIKYLRYPAHDLASKVPDFIGGGEMVILLLILLTLPFGLGLGLALTLGLALGLVMPYQQPRERLIGLVFLVLLAIGPALVYAAAPLVSFHGSVVDAMAEATSEAFAREAETRLTREGEGRDDYARAMILGHRSRQRGEVKKAEAAYRRALQSNPNEPTAHNNLGVVLLMQGRTEQAEQAFRTAVAKKGGAEPHLNLGLMAADRGRFDESNSFMERARAIDPQLVARHTLMSGSMAKKAAVAPLDEGLLWERLFAHGRTEAAAISAQIMRPLSGRLPLWLCSGLLLVIGALGLWAGRYEDQLSAPCPKCGLPAPRFSQGSLCDQCKSVFLSSIAVEPRLRDGKERSVRRHQRRRRWAERALSVVAGAGHMFGGRPGVGLLLFLPFAVLGLGILVGEQSVVHPWFVYVDETAYHAKAIVAGAALVILSAVSLKTSFDK